MEGRARKGLHEFRVDELLGKAEIRDFDHAFLEQNIGGFEIAVDDLVHGQHLHPAHDLREDGHGLRLLQPAPRLDQLCERALGAVLEEEIEVVFCLFDVDEVHDVVVLAPPQQVDLSLDRLDEVL